MGNSENQIGQFGISIVGAIVGGYLGGALGGAAGAQFGSAIGYMAGSYLGSELFPTDQQTIQPEVGKYPVQMSEKGNPVKIEYGTYRMAGNVVWMGDPQPYTITHSVGDNLFGSDPTVDETRYRRSYFIGICEGKRNVLRAWKGKEEIDLGLLAVSNNCEDWADTQTETVQVFTGDGENRGLDTLIGEDFAKYKNMCGVFFMNTDLGGSEAIPNYTFEVSQDVPLGPIVCTSGTEAWRLTTGYKCAIDYSSLTNISFSTHQCKLTGFYAITSKPSVTVEPVYIFDADGVNQNIHFEWAPAYGYAQVDVIHRVRFSKDGSIIYVLIHGAGACGAIFKWNAITGAFIDYVCLSGAQSWAMDIDSADRLWVTLCGAFPYDMNVYDEDLVFVRAFNDVTGTYDVYIEEDKARLDCLNGPAGWALAVGYNWSSPPTHVWIADMQGEKATIKITLPNITGGSARSGIIIDGYAYVNAYNTDHYLFKIDIHTGEIVSQTLMGENSSLHVMRLPGDFIGVTCAQNSVTGTLINASVEVYDTNLTLQDRVIAASDACVPLWSTYGGVESFFMYDGVDGKDANPADIIWDLYTNTRYGAAVPLSRLDYDSFNTIRQYCETNDLLISLEVDTTKPIGDWIDFICTHFGGYIKSSGGKLHLGAWRGEDPVAHIKRKDMVLQGDGPPVTVIKRKYSETNNRIEVNWLDRANIYGPAVATAKDDVDLRVSNKPRKRLLDMTACCRPELAAKLKWRMLYDNMYRFGTYSWAMGYKNILFEVGDVILLSDDDKIDSVRVRITDVSESKDGRNLDIQAMDDISYLYPDLTGWTTEQTDREIPAEDTTDFVLADGAAVFREDLDDAALHISVAPSTANATGWNIWRSYDGTNYTFVTKGSINGVTAGDANSVGTLVDSNLADAPTIVYRYDEWMTVDIGTVTGFDASITDDEFVNGDRTIKVGDEIIAYKTAVDQGGGIWKLSELIRGMHATDVEDHAAGETVATMDITGTYVIDPADIGKTLYFKATTLYGSKTQQLSDATEYTVTIAGKSDQPYPVSLMRIRDREGFGTVTAYPMTMDFYFSSKVSGFNVSGMDAQTWGNFVKDGSLQGVRARLLDTGGTELDNQYFSLNGYDVDSYWLVVEDTDRDGNDIIDVEITPVGALENSAKTHRVELVS